MTVDTDLYYLLHSDGQLWRQAEVEAIKASLVVLAESPATPNHAARVVWANAILADPAAWSAASINRVKVIASGTIASTGNNSPDAAVAAAVASILATVV